MTGATASPRPQPTPGPILVVITGPIGAGKSTLAAEIGFRLRSSGRPTAVLDLDEVVLGIGGFAGLTMSRFRQARQVHGGLVAAWLDQGLAVVAHGPFFQSEDLDTLLRDVPVETAVRLVRLQASFELTAQRVRSDPTRPGPFSPEFLRAAFDRAQAKLETLSGVDWTIDTTTMGISETAEALMAALMEQVSG